MTKIEMGVDRLRAPVDSAVSFLLRRLVEKSKPMEWSSDSLPPRNVVVLHYRPWGAIAHIQNANGTLMRRLEFESGAEAVEQLRINLPPPKWAALDKAA